MLTEAGVSKLTATCKLSLDMWLLPDPVVIVPCVFMIGENGVPLEVSGGYIPPSELAQKFNKALQASYSFSAI